MIQDIVEYFTQDVENNTVIELQHKKQIANSMKILIEGTDETISEFTITSNYLLLDYAIPVGVTLILKYKVEIETPTISTEQKIKQIEDEISRLKSQNQVLAEALSQRVDKHSFRVWLKAVEKQLGISVIDGNPHGIDGINSYRSTDL